MTNSDDWAYQADVAYEVWSGGGDAAAIDRRLVRQHIRRGESVETAAFAELQRQNEEDAD